MMIGTVFGRVGEPLRFNGYANDFGHEIAAVQFSLDGGETWTAYETPGTTTDRNVCWHFAYTPQRAGSYQLMVRSVNSLHEASPKPAYVHFEVA